MLALSIVALILSLIAVAFSAALGAASMKLFYKLETRLFALENVPPVPFQPAQKGDMPAFARNHNPDGPSGHAFHGHPHTLKHPGSKS